VPKRFGTVRYTFPAACDFVEFKLDMTGWLPSFANSAGLDRMPLYLLGYMELARSRSTLYRVRIVALVCRPV
jgi:hypothetical protein